MIKQEEIREGTAEWLWKHRAGETTVQDCVYTWAELPGYRKDDFRASADKLMAYEHSQGVVIKVDANRLPDISYHSAYPENEDRYQQAMLKAGYVAVESLIGESHGRPKTGTKKDS